MRAANLSSLRTSIRNHRPRTDAAHKALHSQTLKRAPGIVTPWATANPCSFDSAAILERRHSEHAEHSTCGVGTWRILVSPVRHCRLPRFATSGLVFRCEPCFTVLPELLWSRSAVPKGEPEDSPANRRLVARRLHCRCSKSDGCVAKGLTTFHSSLRPEHSWLAWRICRSIFSPSRIRAGDVSSSLISRTPLHLVARRPGLWRPRRTARR
jgi:hypothetical protein